jgi:hypothetical protein
MLNRRTFAAAAIGALAVASSAAAQSVPQEWDGLQRVDSERFRNAYLAPGAEFTGYSKVMLDPTEAAFTRNWQRDYNSSAMSLSDRITDTEASQILQEVQTAFHQSLTEAYRNGGYEIVTSPGPDVLRVRTGVANIRVSAPDSMSAGRTRTYAEDAGQATLIIELRDSMSGAVLGRAVDAQRVDDSGFMMRRNRSTNRWDFTRTFDRWSQNSVEALNHLRQLPAPAIAGGSG